MSSFSFVVAPAAFAIAPAPQVQCTGRAAQSPTSGVQKDYNLLEREMIWALGKDPKAPTAAKVRARYDEIFANGKSFATQVADCFRQLEFERPYRDGSFDKVRAPSEYPRQIEEALGGGRRGANSAQAKAALSKGGDVFAAFEGPWNCTWRQDKSSGQFEHNWGRTEKCERLGVAIQPVTMGPVGNLNQAAINAVDVETGVITGAVGNAANGESARPHVGYYLGPQRLLWLAQEGQGSKTYSVFVENSGDDGVYSIFGIDFDYDARTKKISNCKPKAGQLVHPLPLGESSKAPAQRSGSHSN